MLEKLVKLSKEERQKVIMELLKDRSERELSKEIGIPHSTIHDWKTLRQDNIGSRIHISLNNFYRKLSETTAKDITDWGRLEQIRDLINDLLNQRQ